MLQELDDHFHSRPLAATLTLLAALALKLGTANAGSLPKAPEPGDFPYHPPEQVALGKVLFYDKILSGNKNISCATCHHALAGTGDGLSLPVGEGGNGLGVTRDTGRKDDAILERVPRNAPFIFNFGAYEFEEMFHDGRVEVDPSQPSGFRSPAGDDLPIGLDSPLAVQAMFPVTSGTEMAGQSDENKIGAAAAAGDLPKVWRRLAKRLRRLDDYVQLFKIAYPEITKAADITYVHAANAIAAYEDEAFRAINSPFDRYLRGDRHALSVEAKQGMNLFFGKAGCSKCHSGPLLTDHGYHAIAMPQIGPGKGDPGGADPLAPADFYGDFGREQATRIWEIGNYDTSVDRYKFRTPSLRNVALTGPWGHDGAYNSLEAVVRHHLDPENALWSYDPLALEEGHPERPVLPSRTDLDSIDFVHHYNADNLASIAAANELAPVSLTDGQLSDLMAFLHALTDPGSLDLRSTVPARVPSGLPLAD